MRKQAKYIQESLQHVGAKPRVRCSRYVLTTRYQSTKLRMFLSLQMRHVDAAFLWPWQHPKMPRMWKISNKLKISNPLLLQKTLFVAERLNRFELVCDHGILSSCYYRDVIRLIKIGRSLGHKPTDGTSWTFDQSKPSGVELLAHLNPPTKPKTD